MRLLKLSAALALAAAGLSACGGDGVTRPPPTLVRVINAVPNRDSLDFMREERNQDTLRFTETASFTFDSDTYDISIDATPGGPQGGTRLRTVSRTLTAENEYTFVMFESGTQVDFIVVEEPVFPEDSSDAQIIFAHASEDLPPFDVYLELPGTDLSSVSPIGRLRPTRRLPAITRPPDDYRIFLTEPGKPGTVLFRSRLVTLAAGASPTIAFVDDGGRGISDILAIAVDQGSVVLPDRRDQSGIRVINAIADRMDRDIYLDGDFTGTFTAPASFAVVPDYVLLPSGAHELNVTPAGNPSVEEDLVTLSLSPGRLYTVILAGNTTTGIESSYFIEDRRRIIAQANLRFINAAEQLGPLAVYIVEPGGSLRGLDPVSIVGTASTLLTPTPPGDYEMVLRDSDTSTRVAGRLPIALLGRRNYGILAVNAPGGSTADIVLFDDF